MVMGPGQNFLTQVGLGRACRLWFGYGFQKFPLEIPNFSIFSPSGQKNLIIRAKSTNVKDGLASYLLQLKSMLGSGPISTSG